MTSLGEAVARVKVEMERRAKHSYGHCSILPEDLHTILAGMDSMAWRPIETAPYQGIIQLLCADKTGSEKRTFAAEASFSDGIKYWVITSGWVGWTRLHSEWTPIGWKPLSPPESSHERG